MDDFRNPSDQREDILYLLGQVDTNVKSLLISRDKQDERLTIVERWKTRVGTMHTAAFATLPLLGYFVPEFVKHFLKGNG